MWRYVIWGILAIVLHGWLLATWKSENPLPKPMAASLSTQVDLLLVRAETGPKDSVREPVATKNQHVPAIMKSQSTVNPITKSKPRNEPRPKSQPEPTLEPEPEPTSIRVYESATATSTLEFRKQPDDKTVSELTPKTNQNIALNSQHRMPVANSKLPNGLITPRLAATTKPLKTAILRSTGKPKYPRRSILRNQTGRVKVKILISQKGLSEAVELVQSSGHRLLDQSVLQFVKRAGFLPATQNGQAIASYQVFSFRFVLE
jgi:protein TonB